MTSQVDSFWPGQQLPFCCLNVEWIREDNPMRLKHRICLVRAKGPFNFFCIKLIPEIPRAMEGREMERISTVQMCVVFFYWSIHSAFSSTISTPNQCHICVTPLITVYQEISTLQKVCVKKSDRVKLYEMAAMLICVTSSWLHCNPHLMSFCLWCVHTQIWNSIKQSQNKPAVSFTHAQLEKSTMKVLACA